MTGRLIVAIDGPGGVGKSTVSREVARRLGAAHLDTGAFYRAATLVALEAGVDAADPAAVMAALSGRRIDQSDGRTTLDGRDVSAEIRGEDVTRLVSVVSAHPEVRVRLVEAQQRWVHRHGSHAVVEGRDIGTVVFPGADVKVFLDADPAVRAARRSREIGAPSETVAEALARRDQLDQSRAASPLMAADDAVTIDTTYLGVEQVVEQVMDLVARAHLA